MWIFTLHMLSNSSSITRIITSLHENNLKFNCGWFSCMKCTFELGNYATSFSFSNPNYTATTGTVEELGRTV